MKHPDCLILYVENPTKSADFYHRLLAAPIVESSPNFAMLALASGVMLGLWAVHDVNPRPTTGPGGFELGITVENDAQVDAALGEAHKLAAPIVQQPVRLDFGYTFVLRSPDGHFLRVFSPS